MSNRIKEEFLQKSEPVRLNKYLSEAGVCSRREADRLIETGRVTVDAEKINRMLGTNISEEDMLGYFKKIDLDYDAETKEVIAPTFRHDLFRIADLAEEDRKSVV